MENVFDLDKFNKEKKWKDFKESCKTKAKATVDWCSNNKELLIIAVPAVLGTTKAVSRTIGNLKAKKKYYVRIRTYKTVGKTTYYSSWSASKNVTTKK